jgi:DNA-directed RNA polymerase subunit RPC12/RpoP
MPLSPADQKTLDDWLHQHCPKIACAACGHRQFVSGERITIKDAVVTFSLPTVPVVCIHCGYVIFFAAKTIGLSP